MMGGGVERSPADRMDLSSAVDPRQIRVDTSAAVPATPLVRVLPEL